MMTENKIFWLFIKCKKEKEWKQRDVLLRFNLMPKIYSKFYKIEHNWPFLHHSIVEIIRYDFSPTQRIVNH